MVVTKVGFLADYTFRALFGVAFPTIFGASFVFMLARRTVSRARLGASRQSRLSGGGKTRMKGGLFSEDFGFHRVSKVREDRSVEAEFSMTARTEEYSEGRAARAIRAIIWCTSILSLLPMEALS